MSKLTIIRKPAAQRQTATFEYVRSNGGFRPEHPHIRLSSADVVDMLHRLMERVQANIHPTVTWRVRDGRYGHGITMRWQAAAAQFQLYGSVGELGIVVWLHPRFGESMSELGEALAFWHAGRESWVLKPQQYGRVAVSRSEGRGSQFRTKQLHFDHPALDRIPRRGILGSESAFYMGSHYPELGDDIVAVTQRHLAAAGIA